MAPFFENYIVAECLKKITHRKTHSKLYYYRTSNGVEVDLIIDHRHRLELLEIKTTETFHPKMVKPMISIMQEGDQASLLYQGKTLPNQENISILNFQDYLSQIS